MIDSRMGGPKGRLVSAVGDVRCPGLVRCRADTFYVNQVDSNFVGGDVVDVASLITHLQRDLVGLVFDVRAGVGEGGLGGRCIHGQGFRGLAED